MSFLTQSLLHKSSHRHYISAKQQSTVPSPSTSGVLHKFLKICCLCRSNVYVITLVCIRVNRNIIIQLTHLYVNSFIQRHLLGRRMSIPESPFPSSFFPNQIRELFISKKQMTIVKLIQLGLKLWFFFGLRRQKIRQKWTGDRERNRLAREKQCTTIQCSNQYWPS